jgi:hypothetical protein
VIVGNITPEAALFLLKTALMVSEELDLVQFVHIVAGVGFNFLQFQLQQH